MITKIWKSSEASVLGRYIKGGTYLYLHGQICIYGKEARSTWSVIQIASNLYPPTSVANIFGHWLDGISNRYKTLIRVGAYALLWSLWLCRNDVVFNDKTVSPLQVIFRCTHSLRMWSMLQRAEYQPLFKAVCTRLEQVAMEFFTQHGWQHNLRIAPPPPSIEA